MATWRVIGEGFQRFSGNQSTRSSATVVYVTDDLTMDSAGNHEQLTVDQIENDVGLPTYTGIAEDGTGYAPRGTILLGKRLIAGPSRGCAAVALEYGPPSRFRGGFYGGVTFNFTFDTKFVTPKYKRMLSLNNGRGLYVRQDDEKQERAVALFTQVKTVTQPNPPAIDNFIADIAKNYGKGYVRYNIPCILMEARAAMSPGSPAIVEYRFMSKAPVLAKPRDEVKGYGLELPALDWLEDYGEQIDEATGYVEAVRVRRLPEMYQEGAPLP